MWYFILVFLTLTIVFLSSSAKVKYIYDGGMRVEIHFVFFSFHFTKGKKSKKRSRISPGSIFRALSELLGNSTVVVNRLSIPVSSTPAVPDARFLGINISYPLIYAYLTANSRKLIISENAVIREPSDDFEFLVNVSLHTTTINLIRPLLYLLFTAKRRKEA